jgi:GNAT superfamily N-acetyltransferase
LSQASVLPASETFLAIQHTPLLIREPLPGDEAAWRRLWAGYCAFYQTTVTEAVTASTWRRLMIPEHAMFGRIALWKGDIVGFTISVLHEGSWTVHPICYLEDLFVDQNARGHGIGRALIADLLSLARERGWGRLYWHTRRGNVPARRLYDEFAVADDFVRYRIALD